LNEAIDIKMRNLKFEVQQIRKLKYIIAIIWWQFRKKKIKQRLLEMIEESEKHA